MKNDSYKWKYGYQGKPIKREEWFKRVHAILDAGNQIIGGRAIRGLAEMHCPQTNELFTINFNQS